VVLFLATVVTTTIAGILHWLSFKYGFSDQTPPIDPGVIVRGLWYSVSILLILGAHEFGHYFACRHYGVDASLPYFVPAPLVSGTFGAVIRIRQPFPHKRALFDIGIAGPIAGFVVAVPVLLIGMYLSNIVRVPEDFQGVIYDLGEPLLFKMASWLRFGPVAAGYTVNMHPMVFAAWIGMLATTMNLFPMGQLDGGHISYAVLGRRSTTVTLITLAGLIGLAAWTRSMTWMVWVILNVVMLVTFGPYHPRVWDEDVPLDSARMWLVIFAILMFALCFTPFPIEVRDLVPGVRV
jgi:membrane-associated protease RseP (regulator of RpoE activity)